MTDTDRKSKTLASFGSVKFDTRKMDFIKIKDTGQNSHLQNSVKCDQSKVISEQDFEKVKRQNGE